MNTGPHHVILISKSTRVGKIGMFYGLKDGCIDRISSNRHGGHRIGAGFDTEAEFEPALVT
jgi:hypothetical protein